MIARALLTRARSTQPDSLTQGERQTVRIVVLLKPVPDAGGAARPGRPGDEAR
ncbi:MAG: hypothetical protein P4L30_06575 [Candidatus Limnocylindrales bacterium]|nr:hypothetical protein [Candidatus Limnocylindrales bacterium]